MTTRWIAFLRAINVGGHTVKMDALRALFEALGYEQVETFIASGNVIFDAPDAEARLLETQIEAHLRRSLGYEVATFLRTPAEVDAIARCPVFGEKEAPSLYVAFTSAPPSEAAREKLLTYRTEIDDFAIHEREVYWQCQTSISQSTFSGAVLEKVLGMPATMRNITTVRKLAAKFYQPG